MRKAVPFLLAVLLLVGCDAMPSGETRTVRFLAEDAATRTVFTEPKYGIYPVIWTDEGESVMVSLNSATPVEAQVDAAPDGRTASFSVPFTSDGNTASTFYALSPASACTGISDGVWDYSVPTVQTPLAGSVDPSAMVIAATSSTTEGLPAEVNLHFTHLTAYGCFSLVGLDGGIRSVSLDFGGEDVLTLQTPSTAGIWFGSRPRNLSGKEVVFRVRTTAGSLSRSVRFPEGAALEAGRIACFDVDMSGAAFQPDSRSIRILAIGNSFSVDAMEYLYGYLQQAGYEEISLGNLYIGGCTLETHAGNITGDKKAYTYYTNTTGSWGKTDGADVVSALQSQAWDYVSVQQASGSSGMPDTFEPYLSTVIDAVRTHCPGAKLMWHQTWAYQANSSHSEFPKYGCVQIRMYNAIVDAIRQKVLSRGDFEFVIPSGTAIQNLRSSFIGDNVTRDGYHMSYDVGRITAALTWAARITGCPLGGIDCKPRGYSYSVTERQAAAIKDAVAKACQRPLEPTPSADPPQLLAHQSDPALLQALADAGYDADRFVELPYGITTYAYYNSTSRSKLYSRTGGDTAGNLNQFAATPYFSQEDIPTGSVLVLKDGYQYRPEAWKRLSVTNASSARPANVTGPSVIEVGDAWWNGYAYRAFNLAEKNNPPLTDSRMNALRSSLAIFIPK